MKLNIPKSHPRYESLMLRHLIEQGYKDGVTATAGLIAHGRGEAFDYLIGEKSQPFALKAIEAAAALFILSSTPILSVNGNSVILSPKETVLLSKKIPAQLEVNLFYRTKKRELAIKKILEKAGAKNILGVNLGQNAKNLKQLDHSRRIVDPKGIYIADTVFVPLEDGDRTEALIAEGKKVITVDLNPFSRTARSATITIVDNLVRAMPLLIKSIDKQKNKEKGDLKKILENYDNDEILKEAAHCISHRLNEF